MPSSHAEKARSSPDCTSSADMPAPSTPAAATPGGAHQVGDVSWQPTTDERANSGLTRRITTNNRCLEALISLSAQRPSASPPPSLPPPTPPPACQAGLTGMGRWLPPACSTRTTSSITGPHCQTQPHLKPTRLPLADPPLMERQGWTNGLPTFGDAVGAAEQLGRSVVAVAERAGGVGAAPLHLRRPSTLLTVRPEFRALCYGPLPTSSSVSLRNTVRGPSAPPFDLPTPPPGRPPGTSAAPAAGQGGQARMTRVHEASINIRR